MTIHTNAAATRRTLSLPFGGRKPTINAGTQHCASQLSEIELRRLVANMID